MRKPSPQFLIEDTNSPGLYLSLVGRRHTYTREIPHAMRFTGEEAEAWALPHERLVPLEDALQSLAS